MHLELLQTQSSASSRLKLGNTDVQCSVNGPADTPSSSQIPNKAFVTVEVTQSNQKDVLCQARLVSFFTGVIDLHKYPRSVINLSFHVFSNDGSLLSSLINVGYLSLMKAGICLNSFAPAVTLAVTTSSFITDPDLETETSASSVLTIALNPVGQITSADPHVHYLTVERDFDHSNLKSCVSSIVPILAERRELFRGVLSTNSIL
ncbi:hypothetical protein GEMRC1_001277 [Eukaryota sp. GEM-RC1]